MGSRSSCLRGRWTRSALSPPRRRGPGRAIHGGSSRRAAGGARPEWLRASIGALASGCNSRRDWSTARPARLPPARRPTAPPLNCSPSRTRFEDALTEEVRFHLDAYTADLVRSGVPRREAARRASQFGSIEGVKDACRQLRGLRLADDLGQIMTNIRLAVRMLAAVATGLPGSQVREGLGEPGGVVHLEQDVRDPHARRLARRQPGLADEPRGRGAGARPLTFMV